MLGFDLFGLAKKEVLKLDSDKDGIPDVIEALDAGQAATEVLGNFISVFDRQDIAEIIAALPSKVRAKIHPATVLAVGEAIEKLPVALKAARVALEGIELELKRK